MNLSIYLNLPKLKDKQVVALDSPFFLFFFKLFYFGFSKYKAKTNPKTSRLRCVAVKTVNSDKHAHRKTAQDTTPKAGIEFTDLGPV